VRRAAAGEAIVTLDNVTRALDADDLLICDLDDAPIGIAGIMGGFDSEISADTTTVALETAWFEPSGIAATVQRLGLRSEASVRFERGVDPNGMPRSIARFVELLGLTCPDLVVHQGLVDERGNMPATVQIHMRPSAINAVLGTDLTTERMVHLLSSIEFECTVTADRDAVLVNVPSWRPDCTIEVDLAEEIGRLHGFSQIQRRVPRGETTGGLTPIQLRRRQLREVLIGAGISEAMPNPFLAEEDIAAAGLEPAVVRVINSLVADESVLRHSLRPGLLKAIAFNESHRRDGVALFEIGHVYPPSDDELPAEYEALGVLLAGKDASDAVRLWREIAAAMGWGARLDQSRVPAGLHPTRSATLSIGRDVVGAVGEVHPDVADAFGISERVAVLELHLGVLLAAEPKVAAWRPISRYPSSDMDLAFTLPDDVPAEKLDKAIRQGGGALVVHSALFDVYRTGDGARSLAFRVRLQAADRTLTDVELADVRSKMIAAAAKLGAALR
jgi:phenylalanyl-tRNA synthetase beta chain